MSNLRRHGISPLGGRSEFLHQIQIQFTSAEDLNDFVNTCYVPFACVDKHVSHRKNRSIQLNIVTEDKPAIEWLSTVASVYSGCSIHNRWETEDGCYAGVWRAYVDEEGELVVKDVFWNEEEAAAAEVNGGVLEEESNEADFAVMGRLDI